MDRRLLDYLPPVLREVADMQAVNGANEPEIALAWDVVAMVLANQFLETADERGGVNHIFANQTAANGFAFNFKVEVERGPGGQGGYITSVQGGFQ